MKSIILYVRPFAEIFRGIFREDMESSPTKVSHVYLKKRSSANFITKFDPRLAALVQMAAEGFVSILAFAPQKTAQQCEFGENCLSLSQILQI